MVFLITIASKSGWIFIIEKKKAIKIFFLLKMALRESFVGHLRLEKQGWAYNRRPEKKTDCYKVYFKKAVDDRV